MWSKIIYNTDNQLIQDIVPERNKYKKIFIYPIAEGLFNDIQKFRKLIPFSNRLKKEFKNLPKAEKSFWYRLFNRNTCKTCLTESFYKTIRRILPDVYNYGQ
jgi:hypothetical protein